MATTYGIPIANKGLVWALDAFNPKAYTSGSTFVNNLAYSSTTASFVNGGPTFVDGFWVTDGTDDYIIHYKASHWFTDMNTSTIEWVSSGSIIAGFTDDTAGGIGGNSTGFTIRSQSGTGGTRRVDILCRASNSGNLWWNRSTDDSNGQYLASDKIHVCVVKEPGVTGSNSTHGVSIYLNGVECVGGGPAYTATGDWWFDTLGDISQIGIGGTSAQDSGTTRIGTMRIYNRALSPQEINTNYNYFRQLFKF